MKRNLFLLLFVLCCSNHYAVAQTTVTESFTSTTNKNTSQLVWNIARGELHPPLFVDDPADGGVIPDVQIDIGNGSDGAFATLSDYSRVGSVTGTIITLDTATEFNFTNVNILSGYILRPSGSNPLILKVQGDVTVDGVIDCSGDDGAATGGAGSARCGGGAGGAGGLTGGNGTTGGSPTSGGGGGGVDTGGGASGGGGGGGPFRTPSGNPSGTAGLGPNGGGAGTNTADSGFINYLNAGGAGGGGGSSPIGGTPIGGGGGAGGGSIQIFLGGTLTVGATGAIRANGGAGGDRTGLAAGGGGGGAGGSILIFAGVDATNNGTIEALPGAGGGSIVATGGNGFYGRTWISCPFGDAAGNVATPNRELSDPGDVRYGLNTYVTTSNVIDLGNSRPEILSLPMTETNAANGDLTYELAFGDSATDPALSNFNAPAVYLNSQQKRYMVFRITIDNNNDSSPNTVTDLSISYDGFVQQEFDFQGSCGSLGAGPNRHLWLLALPLMTLLALRRRRPVRVRYHRQL